MKSCIIFFFFILSTALFGASLQLKNDTIYELTATILTANGTELETIKLQPTEFRIWSTNLSTSAPISKFYTPNLSLTPFTIIWRCPDGGVYSMCSDVASGAFINARSCQGQKECNPPTEKKEGYQPPINTTEENTPK